MSELDKYKEKARQYFSEIKSLEQERDQLKARAMELEGGLFDCLQSWLTEDPKHISVGYNEILNRQPPQSLESHDREVAARALEEAWDALFKFKEMRKVTPIEMLAELEIMFRKLRARGEKG